MSRDIRNISEKGFLQFAQEAEASALSDTFWRVTLPQNLETTSVNSPAFNTFLAAQDYLKSSSILMKGTMISDLITISGDVHHIFPKAYLKKNGVDSKGRYNQVANYTYLDTQVNKAISDDAPCITKRFEPMTMQNILRYNRRYANLLIRTKSNRMIRK